MAYYIITCVFPSGEVKTGIRQIEEKPIDVLYFEYAEKAFKEFPYLVNFDICMLSRHSPDVRKFSNPK